LRNRKDRPAKAADTSFIVKNKQATRHNSSDLFLVRSFQHGAAAHTRPSLRRRITPEAGRGLEKLAHALEYLADEFIQDGCNVAQDYGRLQAIQLLASLNRQLYFACEVEPTFVERVRTICRRFSISST
jgi:hypothetical protein